MDEGDKGGTLRSQGGIVVGWWPARWWTALLVSVCTVATLIALEAAPARAGTSTFEATADTQIQEANPALNYGTSTALRVDGGADPDVQTFLRFSVSGLTGTVQSATLRLYATSGTAAGPSVFTPAAGWTETGLTWSNRPALVGSGVGKVTTISSSTWAAFDVSSLVTGSGTFDFVLAGTSTDGVDFQSREATNKPQLVVTTTTSGDVTPPTTPGTLTASVPSASRVDLQWGASTDDVGVTGYEIFRDSTLLTTVGVVTSFADTTVSASTSYAYQVRALDASGKRSEFSNTANVTTPAATATTTATFTPTADAYVAETKPTTNYGTSSRLRVDGGTDLDVETFLRFSPTGLSGVVQTATLRLYVRAATVDGPSVFAPVGTWTESGITWSTRPLHSGPGLADTGALATGTWATFDVTPLVTGSGTVDLMLAGTSTDGVDWDAREGSNRPQLVITTTPDAIDPSAPTRVQATATAATQVDLAWTAATDDTGVTSYEVFRGGTLLTTVGAVTSYTDTTAKPLTAYTYTLRARDAAGNRSAMSYPSNEVTTPADTTDPSPPTGLGASAAGPSAVDLGWTAATDDVGVTNYDISRDGSFLATVGAVTTYRDTTVSGTTTYVYTVAARDAAGNTSSASAPASVTTPDGTDPSPPTNVQATAVSATRVDLMWTAGTDNLAVTGYEVYRGPTLLATIGAVTSYSDTTATPQTTYTYTLRARDAAGNRSVMSDPSNPATTPSDTTNPSAPTNLVATATGPTQVSLSWTASTDDVAVTNYVIYRDASPIATIGAVTSYTDLTAAAGVPYAYQVKAKDAAGNVSPASNTATVSTTDNVAPSAPASLSATATAATRVALSWSASTDNVAVTNYEIFRGGTLLATVGAVTTYADTAALPGTTYSYQVRAKDLSGNPSGFSPTASATTPQQTVTFVPVADAKVEEATATTNYATTGLRVDAGTGANVESDLSFTVSGMSGTVRKATLRLYATTGTIDGPAVYPTSTGWTETGITWATRPARTGPAVADVAGISTGTWVEMDVTRLITGNGTFAMTLAGISSDGVDFTSREGTNKPQLVVITGAADTQAPQPPTGLAATSGSPYQVDLSWTAATDDIAVTSYVVLRGTTQLAVIDASQLAYTDTTVNPNTSYSYTVKARDAAGHTSAASNTATVTTPSSSSSAPVIAAAGDIACASTDANYNGGNGTSTACRQLYTSNLLVNGGFAAVLPLGDEQYNSGSLSEFNLVYNPTWGRVKSISRPVVGNHEYGQSGASGYFSYYGSAAGDPSKGYYSFDIGSWHIVALNSNCTKVAGGCDVGSPQETWLRADLSAHPAMCTLAMSHHARWSSGHDGDNLFMQPLWQDLYDAGVEVLLSGHSHNYERFARQNGAGGLDTATGVRQFVVGTGGAFFTGISGADANSQVRNNDTFGILKMTLRSTGYDWQFVPEAGKTFTDSGTTACQ